MHGHGVVTSFYLLSLAQTLLLACAGILEYHGIFTCQRQCFSSCSEEWRASCGSCSCFPPLLSLKHPLETMLHLWQGQQPVSASELCLLLGQSYNVSIQKMLLKCQQIKRKKDEGEDYWVRLSGQVYQVSFTWCLEASKRQLIGVKFGAAEEKNT